jgi:hypothetical protein
MAVMELWCTEPCLILPVYLGSKKEEGRHLAAPAFLTRSPG